MQYEISIIQRGSLHLQHQKEFWYVPYLDWRGGGGGTKWLHLRVLLNIPETISSNFKLIM